MNLWITVAPRIGYYGNKSVIFFKSCDFSYLTFNNDCRSKICLMFKIEFQMISSFKKFNWIVLVIYTIWNVLYTFQRQPHCVGNLIHCLCITVSTSVRNTQYKHSSLNFEIVNKLLLSFANVKAFSLCQILMW